MARSLTLSSSTVASLLNSVLRPAAGDPEPHAPGAPVLRWWEWMMLNPQPLPPRETWGPQPDPWRWAVAVRAEVSTIVDRFEQAGTLVGEGDHERAVEVSGAAVGSLVDDLCATPPRARPFPGPWGPQLEADALSGRSLVVAAAQFQVAADSLGGHPLSTVFEDAAMRLFQAGAERG
ncbi:MAG: hypothetical protein ACLGIF_00350 [Actinomycetes bacterium]